MPPRATQFEMETYGQSASEALRGRSGEASALAAVDVVAQAITFFILFGAGWRLPPWIVHLKVFTSATNL